MHAISAPRREFGWTRIRAVPYEPTMDDCKRSAELLRCQREALAVPQDRHAISGEKFPPCDAVLRCAISKGVHVQRAPMCLVPFDSFTGDLRFNPLPHDSRSIAASGRGFVVATVSPRSRVRRRWGHRHYIEERARRTHPVRGAATTCDSTSCSRG